MELKVNHQKGRHIPYFDFVRGLAILMVVAIHTYNPDNQSINLGGGVVPFIIKLCSTNIFSNFRVLHSEKTSLNLFPMYGVLEKTDSQSVHSVSCI